MPSLLFFLPPLFFLSFFCDIKTLHQTIITTYSILKQAFDHWRFAQAQQRHHDELLQYLQQKREQDNRLHYWRLWR